MVTVTPADVTRYKAAFLRSCVDTCGLLGGPTTTPCRVDDGGSDFRFNTFPLRLQARDYTLKVANDVTFDPGAIVQLTEKGRYIVRVPVETPSISVSNLYTVLEHVPATGGCHLPAPETHQVTFTRKGFAPITVGVILGETNQTAMLGMAVAQYPWTVVVDQALTYSDGTTHVQMNDRMSYSPIPGVTVHAQLGKPSPPRDAFLPVLLYGFEGQG